MTTLDRRAVLRGAGGVAVALPFFDLMRPRAARAALSKGPTPFVVFYSPNGNIRARWRPGGAGKTFALSPILQPLAPHKSDVVVIDGVCNLVYRNTVGAGHPKGTSTCLTARPLIDDGRFNGGAGQRAGYASGISLDQLVAKHALYSGKTRFPSLELAVKRVRTTNHAVMSYGGANVPVIAESDPRKVWKRLFSEDSTDPRTFERLKLGRRSVLDLVKGDFARLERAVGGEDRQRLERHLVNVRELERRVDAMKLPAADAAPAVECASVAMDGAPDNATADAGLPAVSRLQMDLLVTALGCGLARVASLMIGEGASSMSFPWLGVKKGHHGLSHQGDGNQEAQDQLVAINTWHTSQFAYLLARMKETRLGGDGTLLDDSLVLWTNELGKGNVHSADFMPYVLAGRAGGRIETGRFLSYENQPAHNDLLLSLLHILGVPARTFGDERTCKGPLPGLGA